MYTYKQVSSSGSLYQLFKVLSPDGGRVCIVISEIDVMALVQLLNEKSGVLVA